MDAFGVCCFVRKLLWKRNIIVIDAEFTESCNVARISAFGACCPVANKVFKLP